MIDAAMTWPKCWVFLRGMALKSLFLGSAQDFWGVRYDHRSLWVKTGCSLDHLWSSSVVTWTGGVFVYNERQSVDVNWEVILTVMVSTQIQKDLETYNQCPGVCGLNPTIVENKDFRWLSKYLIWLQVCSRLALCIRQLSATLLCRGQTS